MTALIPARIFTLVFTTPEHPAPYRFPDRTFWQINAVLGPVANRMADRGDAWDIAVLDDRGEDVTHVFPCFTDGPVPAVLV